MNLHLQVSTVAGCGVDVVEKTSEVSTAYIADEATNLYGILLPGQISMTSRSFPWRSWVGCALRWTKTIVREIAIFEAPPFYRH